MPLTEIAEPLDMGKRNKGFGTTCSDEILRKCSLVKGNRGRRPFLLSLFCAKNPTYFLSSMG